MAALRNGRMKSIVVAIFILGSQNALGVEVLRAPFDPDAGTLVFKMNLPFIEQTGAR